MTTYKQRPVVWLLIVLGLLVLTACNSAVGDEPAPATDQPVDDEPLFETVAAQPATTEPTTTEPAPTAIPTGEPASTDLPPTADDSSESSAAESDEELPQSEEPAGSVAGIMTVDDRSDRQKLAGDSWGTDWSRHTVPYDELIVVLPRRDGIPSLDVPTFVSQDEASIWLAGNEPVVAVEIDGEARAYPLQILTWHEIVNDTIRDVPIAVTFCPLCNSAVTFDRRLGDQLLTFGTSGWLRNSDLVMYDRQTESLWQQFTGEGIVGEMAGETLTFLATSIVSFADFSEAFPEGQILSKETGHSRNYGVNPYGGYDTIGEDPFLFFGDNDGRLPAVERVVTVSFDDVDVAYPLPILAEMGVINDTEGEHELVVFHTGGTASALDSPVIAESTDVGATGVFDPNLDGQNLTFTVDGEDIVDDQTGSTWNILGQAIDGPLAGQRLTPIVHGDHFWFSWAAFKPDTIIYSGDSP